MTILADIENAKAKVALEKRFFAMNKDKKNYISGVAGMRISVENVQFNILQEGIIEMVDEKKRKIAIYHDRLDAEEEDGPNAFPKIRFYDSWNIGQFHNMTIYDKNKATTLEADGQDETADGDVADPKNARAKKFDVPLGTYAKYTIQPLSVLPFGGAPEIAEFEPVEGPLEKGDNGGDTGLHRVS